MSNNAGDALDIGLLEAVVRLMDPSATGLDDLERLSGGASLETWSFVVRGARGERLVLRRAASQTAHGMSAGLDVEAATILAVARSGVPVPAVRHILKPEDGLGAGFVSSHVAGETVVRKILRDAEYAGVRNDLARQFGNILSQIHAVPADQLPPLRTIGVERSLGIVEAAVGQSTVPRPVFQLALRWLRQHRPAEPGRLSLVHGDFRNGNMIIGSDGVRAVLDWELVHLGDPVEDLAWLCLMPWRFGRPEAPAGGVGSLDDLVAGYVAGGGEPFDLSRMRWWEVLGSLRWGAHCAATVDVFRNSDPSVERAMIARRASESELDLLRLLDLGD